MKRSRIVVLAMIGLLSFAACGTPTPPPDDDRFPPRITKSDSTDVFGLPHLHASAPESKTWTSDWRKKRNFDGVDPDDAWFDADHGSAEYSVVNDELRISGRAPRMYIHDPNLMRQWRNVEITAYFKRVSDANVPYAGMTAVARSNHGVTGDETQDLCDTRGYGARMRYDGYTDFEKETSHPHNDARARKRLWDNGMPKNVWIGYKFLVYDAPADHVKLELWRDMTNGKDGGDWKLVNHLTDDGHSFGDEPCATGIDPKLALTRAPSRSGSESGKPNISVFFRSDGVGNDGLIYRWASVREIKS